MKVYNAIMKFLEVILTVIMFLLVIIVTAQVFFRFVLANPIGWSEQICRFLFMWSILLGIPCIFYEKNDMVFDIIYNKFPAIGRKILSTVFNVLGMAFSVFYFMCALELVEKTGNRMTSGVKMPVNALYGAQCVCAVMLFVAFAVRTIETVKKGENR